MAENYVVKEQLTADMIEAGAELTKALDDAGLPVAAAFWLFDPEINEWRLLFSSPEVATHGRRKVYGQIHDALDRLAGKVAAIHWSAISLHDPDSELLRALRVVRNTGPGIHRIRFRRGVANGRYINDAFIYRVT